jgi:hypothetical protein
MMLTRETKSNIYSTFAVLAVILTILSLPFILTFKWSKPATVTMKPGACTVFAASSIPIEWISPDLCQAHVKTICTPVTGCQWSYESLDGSQSVQLHNPGQEIVATTTKLE